MRQDLATLEHLAGQIAELEAEVARLSISAPWAEQVPYVMQLPGFSVLLTMTVLAAVGDVRRFAHAKPLVGYAGLGASVHDSGGTHRTGRITKTGRRELRWALVEAAWSAVRYICPTAGAGHPYWKAEFERLARRMPENKAIVAIARKLLVAIWYVLTKHVADEHAEVKMIATKLMRWAWQLSDEQRGGLTSRQFIRYRLMRLKLGDDLTHLKYGNTLAPARKCRCAAPDRFGRVVAGAKAGTAPDRLTTDRAGEPMSEVSLSPPLRQGRRRPGGKVVAKVRHMA